MKKEMNLLYEVHDNLYVNLTNRCPCACTFCLRQNRDEMNHSGSLWLEHEPSVDELKNAFLKIDISKYNGVVFCGFGEPTERLDVLLETAKFVKEKFDKPIRVNTNGLSDLINNKNTAPMFQGLVNTISISLNTPSAERFYEITKSKFGLCSFDAMLKFAGNVKNYVDHVILSTVSTTLTGEEEEQCQKICDELGVTYRIREYE